MVWFKPFFVFSLDNLNLDEYPRILLESKSTFLHSLYTVYVCAFIIVRAPQSKVRMMRSDLGSSAMACLLQPSAVTPHPTPIVKPSGYLQLLFANDHDLFSLPSLLLLHIHLH